VICDSHRGASRKGRTGEKDHGSAEGLVASKDVAAVAAMLRFTKIDLSLAIHVLARCAAHSSGLEINSFVLHRDFNNPGLGCARNNVANLPFLRDTAQIKLTVSKLPARSRHLLRWKRRRCDGLQNGLGRR
jgi:hypothetical protein